MIDFSRPYTVDPISGVPRQSSGSINITFENVDLRQNVEQRLSQVGYSIASQLRRRGIGI